MHPTEEVEALLHDTLQGRRALKSLVFHDGIAEVPDQNKLRVRCASPEDLCKEAVPGSSLNITLLHEESYHVCRSESESFDKHLWIVEITGVVDLCLLLRVVLIVKVIFQQSSLLA